MEEKTTHSPASHHAAASPISSRQRKKTVQPPLLRCRERRALPPCGRRACLRGRGPHRQGESEQSDEALPPPRKEARWHARRETETENRRPLIRRCAPPVSGQARARGKNGVHTEPRRRGEVGRLHPLGRRACTHTRALSLALARTLSQTRGQKGDKGPAHKSHTTPRVSAHAEPCSARAHPCARPGAAARNSPRRARITRQPCAFIPQPGRRTSSRGAQFMAQPRAPAAACRSTKRAPGTATPSSASSSG